MRIHHRSYLSRLLLLAVLPLLAIWLLAVSASAQQPAPAEPAAPAAAELEALLETLENDAERQKLVENLRTLLEAQRVEDEAAEDDLGARLMGQVSGAVGELSGELAGAAVELTDLPLAAIRGLDSLRDPDVRARVVEVVWKVAAVLIGGLLAEFLLNRLLVRPRRNLGERHRNGWLFRLFYLILGTLLEVLPIIAFGVVALTLLPMVEPRNVTRLVALAFINAILLSRIITLVARMLLMPDRPRLRLLPMSDETASYLQVWVKRFTVVGVYGYFLLSAALMLGLARSAYDVLLTVLGLILTGMMVVFILQQRQPVRDLIAGRGATTTLGNLRLRFAEVWHVLAMAYVIGGFLVWTLNIEGGFEFLLRGTLLTVLILAVARTVSHLIRLLIDRIFRLHRELRERHPLLEIRANRYVPAFHRILNITLGIVTLLLILEVWGLEPFNWLNGEEGRALLSTLFLIGFVLVIALLFWEVFSAWVESTIQRRAAEGGGQRLRTLLPLAQNALRIVLVVMVGLIVLSEIGVNIAPLLAGAGVVGLAIGFGAQALVKDIITGIFILIEDSVAVGDVVLVAGHSGVVERLTVRSMFLRDLEGNVHALPFGVVDTIQNYTKEFSYALLDIRAPYREDLDRVIGVMREVAEGLRADEVHGQNITGEFELLGVDGFEDTGALIRARLKTVPLTQWSVKREFNRRIKRAFDEYGIEFPYPHHRLYFGESREGDAPPVRILRAAPRPPEPLPDPEPMPEPQRPEDIPSEVPDMPEPEEPPGRPA